MIKTESKPKLLSTKKIIREVSSDNFEEFIKAAYGQIYDFVSSEDAKTGESLYFDVRSEELDSSDIADLKMFRLTGEGHMLSHIILIDSCIRGFIPPGEYYIYAEW